MTKSHGLARPSDFLTSGFMGDDSGPCNARVGRYVHSESHPSAATAYHLRTVPVTNPADDAVENK